MKKERKLICVICGHEWKNKFSNVCPNPDCGGLCTWGYELGKPLSWTITENGWVPNPIPYDPDTYHIDNKP